MLRKTYRHYAMCGDSTSEDDVAKLMDGEKADMVFTSPPYSDQRDYGGNLNLDPYHLAKAVFNFPAIFYAVNLGIQIKNREIVTYWDEYLRYAKERDIKLLSWNIWDKGNASAPAHQQAMFGLCHEWVFIFGEYKKQNLIKENKGAQTWGQPTVREKDGSLTKKSKVVTSTHRQLDTVIDIPAVKNYSDEFTEHPAQFPIELAEQYILSGTNKVDLVSDPFLGSGSTLIACEKTNRKCYGMEIDVKYMNVILKRFEEYSGDTVELVC